VEEQHIWICMCMRMHMCMHMHICMHVEEQWRQLACSSWHELDRTGPDRPEPD